MFKRKQEEERKISQLEKRICDLESPYKYEIGKKVSFNDFEDLTKVIEGIIVGQSFKYKNINYCILLKYNLLEPHYVRENFYNVYVDKKKHTYNVEEQEILK